MKIKFCTYTILQCFPVSSTAHTIISMLCGILASTESRPGMRGLTIVIYLGVLEFKALPTRFDRFAGIQKIDFY